MCVCINIMTYSTPAKSKNTHRLHLLTFKESP